MPNPRMLAEVRFERIMPEPQGVYARALESAAKATDCLLLSAADCRGDSTYAARECLAAIHRREGRK